MDEDLPDPAEIAAWLDRREGDAFERRMYRFGARYILAGLELALEYQRRHGVDA